jgi:6-phosphogluconolactonase
MDVEVYPDDAAVAAKAAVVIAESARRAVSGRGRFVMAVSGGKTPWMMLRELANEQIAWDKVHVFQIDERIAPLGHPDRNLTHLRESLLEHAPLKPEQIHAMPVEAADLEAAAAQYSLTLQEFAGDPPVLDLAHLGMGPDGHTASLVPGDPVLDVRDRDIALTGVYQGRRRMTMTYPILNRSRMILWLITGAEKAPMLQRLRKSDPSIPSGRVHCNSMLVLADQAAIGSSGEHAHA